MNPLARLFRMVSKDNKARTKKGRKMVETLYCREKIEPGHSGRGCSISSWEEGADDPKFKTRVGLHSKSEASLGHKKNRVKKWF